METKKYIVWDLFGGLNNSVRTALKDGIHFKNFNTEFNAIYEIYTFDILQCDKKGLLNNKIDLSINIEELINYFDKFPKPDIIVASPICSPFSRASAMRNGSSGFVINNFSIKYRKKEDFLDKNVNPNNYNYLRLVKMRQISTRVLENTINLINYYNPKYYYIENPQKSLLWRYLDFLNFLTNNNICHYGAYGHTNKKPTIIASNIEMRLKIVEKGYRNQISFENIKKKDRSDIPSHLIQEIFFNFLENEFWKNYQGSTKCD